MSIVKKFIDYDEVERGRYPDDFFSYPKELYIDNFSHLASVGLEGDIAELDNAFFYNDIKLINAQTPYTSWSFCAKSTCESSLNISYFLYRIPKSIRYEIRSKGGHPFSARLNISTMGWKRTTELTSARYEFKTEGKGGRESLIFDLSSLNDSGRITLPICDITLSVMAETGKEYELELYGVYAEFDTYDKNGFDFTIPAETKTGKSFCITCEAIPSYEKALDFEFRKGKYVYYRHRQRKASETSDTFFVTLPSWLAGGDYTVTVAADGIRIDRAEKKVFVKGAAALGFPNTERRMKCGRPCVYVDGALFPWSGYSSYDYVPGSVSDFADSGINLFCIPVACGQHIHAHVADPTALGFGRYDYGQIDERVGFSLQATSGGKLLLRVNLLLPRQWIDEHPGCEPLVLWDGKQLKWAETSGVRDISLMCDEWINDQTAELQKLLDYCASRPWGNRVIGIMLSGEVTEEWFAWAANSEGRYYGDYSSHASAKFRDWILRNDKDADTTLSPYAVPLPDQRKFSGARFKPNTPQGRLAAAYSEFLNEYTASVICHFASVVKKSSQGKLLCGSLYGYAIQLAGDARQSNAGHMGIEQFLCCDDLDYIAGIPWLNYRDTVNGYDTFVSVAESIQAHGKLVVNENDSFSVFHPFIWHRAYNGAEQDDVTGGASLMHRSTYAYDFVHNNPRQYFSLMATWHYHSGIQKVISQLAELHESYYGSDLNRQGTEEIAFMIDDHSFAWAEETSFYSLETISKSLCSAGRAGAPVGTWILSDIDLLPERIRLVIVTNAAAPTLNTIKKLKSAADKGGRTILVLGELGVITPKGADDDVIMFCKQFCVDKLDDPYASPEKRIYKKALSYGGTLIHSTVPITHPEEYRSVFKEAGVHCYTETENYGYVSEEAASFTAGKDGDLVISFRDAVQATDIYTGMKQSGQIQHWLCLRGQTRLFVLEKE